MKDISSANSPMIFVFLAWALIAKGIMLWRRRFFCGSVGDEENYR